MNHTDLPAIRIALIAAVSTNGVIGVDNALPWRIPEDLQYFKRLTLGKKIVMGRKTFESIGSPLPGRKNIVITRNKTWSCNSRDVDVLHTIEEALQHAVNLSLRDGNQEVMVIGGEQIYRESINSANRLYLTRVCAEVEGDATFPTLNNDEWQEVERQEREAIPPSRYNYAFTVLDRVTD